MVLSDPHLRVWLETVARTFLEARAAILPGIDAQAVNTPFPQCSSPQARRLAGPWGLAAGGPSSSPSGVQVALRVLGQ